MNEIDYFSRIDNFISMGSFSVDELNEETNKMFKILPFFKVLGINDMKIRRIICFLLDNYLDLDEHNKIKLDLFLIDYGWISHKRNSQIYNNDFVSNVMHKILKHDNFYFTSEQFELYNKLKTFYDSDDNFYFISAPTSFGKTSIVVDSLDSCINKKKNILLIMPNKNLINEMLAKIKAKYDAQNINISSSVMSFLEKYVPNEANVFVGTAERYFGINQINESIYFDLLIIDEAHKVYNYINDRSRYLALTIKKHDQKSKIIFIAPNIDITSLKSRLDNLDIRGCNIRENLYESEIVSYNNLIVKCSNTGELSYYSMNESPKKYLSSTNINNFDRTNEDFLILKEIFNSFPYTKRKSIIYLSSPDKIFLLASSLKKILTKKKITNEVTQAYFRYLDENFPDSYLLKELLSYGVVINVGPMDDLSKKFSINCFSKDETIDFILANATINEGVNLYAKNIIVLTNKILADHTDINIVQKNLFGRVGRFNQYFIGNRVIVDKTKNENTIVKRLKANLDSKPIIVEKSNKIIDADLKIKMSQDEMFSDEFLQENNIKRVNRIKIPLSRYTYPESVFEIIEKYFENEKITDIDSYLNSFFSFEKLNEYLLWFRKSLKEIDMLHVLFSNSKNQRNIPYLVSLYLDYLRGVSIKTIIEKNENTVMDIDKNGQFYFRFDTIYVNQKADFDYWEKDLKINFSLMSNQEKIDFENQYIIQLLKDINYFCAYSLKKLLMVTFNVICVKSSAKQFASDIYGKYWNMLESGTINDKIITLLSKGIDDKYLQGKILADDLIYHQIVSSDDICQAIIDAFGKDSVEYYAFTM